MTERKGLPIGIDDFKGLIENNYYFADKTLILKQLIDNVRKVNLFTRPRRFGKTLNLSMIQYYFEKTEKDNSHLFDGLKIMDTGEKYTSCQGQYPVINLTLKGMKQPSFKEALFEYKTIIINEFERHRHIMNSCKITNDEKNQFESICNRTAEKTSYATALRLLSNCLTKVYNKNVIILIDEYDVPLENAYFRGFYDEMVDLIRSAFESALKTNPSLEFSVLTGCLRVSKESIFTGLNNLDVYSVCNNKFSDYFGFTESEVKQMTEYFDITDSFSEMKEWYDGYLFGETEIYNPWSILKYIQSVLSKEQISAEAYWSNTSSNDIIHQLIVEGDDDTKIEIENLLEGGSVSKPLYEDITYRNINVNSDYIWSFLLYTGYLKPIRIYKNSELTYFDGVIPNVEVKSIYRSTIMQWFQKEVRSRSHEDIFEAVINEKADEFQEILTKWLGKTISYFDENESYYHGFLSGMLSRFNGYAVKSNRESGNGRPDILILERSYHRLAIIIELKVANKFKYLEKKCNEALQQIEDNNYQAELIDDCYQKIIKYGIAFNGKSCMVKLG